MRLIQNARKSAGLEVSDRISLVLDAEEELEASIREHADTIRNEVLATSLNYSGERKFEEQQEVDGQRIRIALSVAD